MSHTKLPQSSENVFPKRRNGVFPPKSVPGVRQDKRAFASARTGTRQPAAATNNERALPLDKKLSRFKRRPTPQSRTVKVTLWVKPGVKAELQRQAEQEELSTSAAGSALLEQALQHNIDMHYSAFLQPIIEQAIQKQMQSISTRLAWLLVRVAFDAGQTRNLVTNILGRQAGVTPAMLKTILEQSGKAAKGNITKKTPQLIELMDALEVWLAPDGEEKKARA